MNNEAPSSKPLSVSSRTSLGLTRSDLGPEQGAEVIGGEGSVVDGVPVPHQFKGLNHGFRGPGRGADVFGHGGAGDLGGETGVFQDHGHAVRPLQSGGLQNSMETLLEKNLGCGNLDSGTPC